jgi:hypothetical protein
MAKKSPFTLKSAIGFSKAPMTSFALPEGISSTVANRGGKSKTKINCILGDFKPEDGLMETENTLIDTTNVRAEGEGTVDFKTNKLNLFFKPRPKRSELFNLGVPIRVSGTLSEFKIRTDPHNILWFFARIAFFVYDYTLQIVTQKGLPLDGHDVCTNAM